MFHMMPRVKGDIPPIKGRPELYTGSIGGEAHMPFGGIKATGVGPREMGPDAWKFYAESKTIYINHALAARKNNLF